ncbi:MAG: hypothetical protein WBL07_18675, partial [Thiothrix litoralis]|uniref:hypothetical protein n=1 Tax=Thiothrix litoralis TaxID=2891210 RepID=UPI003C76C1AA
MAIHLEEYQEFLEKITPEVRVVLDASYQEASRMMSPTGVKDYLDGAKALCQLGRGNDVVLT